MAWNSLLKNTNPRSEMQLQYVPTMSPQQQGFYNQLMGIAKSRLGPTPEDEKYKSFLSGYGDWARSTTSEVYNPQSVRDYYKSAVMPAFEEDVVPGIREEYAGPGYWGSARADAVAKAYRDVGRQEATDIFEVDKTRQGALMSLLGQQPQVEQMLYYMSDPTTRPAYQAAVNLLGIKEWEPVTWMKESRSKFGSFIDPGGIWAS